MCSLVTEPYVCSVLWQFFPQYPPPSVPSIQPVIPPTGPFSSLQGAFQPKVRKISLHASYKVLKMWNFNCYVFKVSTMLEFRYPP